MSEINGKKMTNLKSHSSQGPKKKIVPVKNKTLLPNDTIRSTDTADRMKKRKLFKPIASDDVNCNRASKSIFEDSPCRKMLSNQNVSAMSTNFSHYELMRNLSALNCQSGGAFSATTCDIVSSSSATLYKRELLEKYFRSAEKWNKEYKIFDTNHDYY